jgi:hypothetical protein
MLANSNIKGCRRLEHKKSLAAQATLSGQHFAIARKTFHKWLKRFKDSQNTMSGAWLTNAKHLTMKGNGQ